MTITVKALDYVVLIVSDLDESIGFYTRHLGLGVRHRRAEFAQLETGQTRLGLYTREAMSRTLCREPRAGGAEPFELGFIVDDCDAAYRALAVAGIPLVTPPVTRPWGQRTAYVADPDGNLIELVEVPAAGVVDAPCPD